MACRGWVALVSANSEKVSHAYGDVIRLQLVHEDGLMVNRLSWLVASQSFLFTAYAIVLNGSTPAQGAAIAARQAELLRVLPELGLATCALIYLGVLAGVRVIAVLRRDLRPHQSRAAGLTPLLQGTGVTHALGLAAPLLLPPLFCAAWTALLA